MEIEEWVKSICYFEFRSSLHNQLIHIYPTIDLTQNEQKSLFSLAFPRVVGTPQEQFYSFNIKRGENILHGYAYFDPAASTLPPLHSDLWSSSSDEEDEQQQQDLEKILQETKYQSYLKKNKSKNKEKQKEKEKKKKKKKKTKKKSEPTKDESSSESELDQDPDKENLCGKQLFSSGGRSVVVLTKYPWESLFFRLLEELGPEILDDPGCLEAWYNFIEENWPNKLEINQCYTEFPLTREQRLRLFVPGEAESIFEHSGEVSCYQNYMGLDLDIASLLKPVFGDLWKLWQLVLTGEPIVVFAPQPEICSQVVRVLCSLIYPFQYQGLVIPYCTKYDSNWNRISSIDFSPKSNLPKHHPKKKNIIVGTTDYELGATDLYYWPNHLFVGKKKKKKRDRIKEGLFMDSENTVLVHKKMHKWLTKEIKQVSIDQEMAQKTIAIRDYFYHFTKDFISPFESYFNTLLPNMVEFDPFYSQMELKGFNETEFIENMLSGKKKLPFQKNEVSDIEFLYKKFIHTKTFKIWYNNQRDLCAEVFWNYSRKAVIHIELQELLKDNDDNEEKIKLFKLLDKKCGEALSYNDLEFYQKYIQLMKEIVSLLPKKLSRNLEKILLKKLKKK
ncbi:hypothetical protein M0812_14280 [Anaeramoeba flamelloides]|uniref:UDENN domain-containing protein n=1 Tax=Anaeramoeba flamelloides TaxID=1746091 RepID=A0AAV7ZEZ8_9EUKA|nr:hypothetical protein M0812_14280 [Anaeramoeba flamelloides]